MRRRTALVHVTALLSIVPLLAGATGGTALRATPELADVVDTATAVVADGTELVAGIDEALAEAVVTSSGDTLATVGCEAPLELDPVAGCVRPLEDGLLAYTAPDGTVGVTHGADHAPADHEHEHEHDHDHGPDELAGGSSRTLPSTRRPLVCAASGEARTVVLYGHRKGANRIGDHAATIRQTMERSNQAVAQSAQRSGGPLADLKVSCTSSGSVAVKAVEIGSVRLADLRATLKAAGYDRPNEKYLVFADAPSPQSNVAGTADMYRDDRRSVDNHNNGRFPMYAVVYGGYFKGSVALHELAHTMGAVQPGAPQADGQGHCTDQLDVVCYPSSSSRCGSLAFDCGNDTYFSTATRPGQWLHTNWNLGWEGHRFIQLGGAKSSSTAPAGTFADTGGHPHDAAIGEAVSKRIATGYSDGTFRPGASVSRAQMATFVTRAFGLPAGDASRFRDVGPGPHQTGIGAVVRAGVTTGYPDRTFRPNTAVTRGQMATFLARALDLPAARRSNFTDVKGSPHADAIAAVAAAGIANGYSDGTYRPNQPVPRGQMAAFLVRAVAKR